MGSSRELSQHLVSELSVLLMPNSTLKGTRGSLRREGVIISLGRERGGVYMQYPTEAVKGVI